MNNEAYGFSGCTFWLDAAYGVPTLTDGATISSWIERIKGIRFLQTTGANQPVFRLSDSNFNNFPSVDFLTGAPVMQTNSDVIPSSEEYTYWAVFKHNGIIAGGQTIFSKYNTPVTTSAFMVIGGNFSAVLGIGWRSAMDTVQTQPYWGSNVEDTSPHIAIWTNERVYVDGLEFTFTPTYTIQGGWNTIGYSIGTPGRNLCARLAEVGILSYKLNSSECLRLSNNINAKYSIY
jgi:hypothetical protein